MDRVALPGRTTIEITGNETFIHLDFGGADWVMHARGVDEIEVGTELDTYVDIDRLLLFSADGATRLGAAS